MAGYPSPFRLSSCRKRLEGPVVLCLVDLTEEALRIVLVNLLKPRTPKPKTIVKEVLRVI